MIRALVEQTFDSQKKYYELAGLSTDSKPTSDIVTGSRFFEVDTGLEYAFDETGAQWAVVGLTPDEIKAEIDLMIIPKRLQPLKMARFLTQSLILPFREPLMMSVT